MQDDQETAVYTADDADEAAATETITRSQSKRAKAPGRQAQAKKPISGSASQPAAAEVAAAQQRVYKREVMVDHDLYRLEIANLTRNIAYDGQEPVWESIPHIHHFHSVDSTGRPQTVTPPVAGHFHEVVQAPAAPGEIASVVAGPPMKWVIQRIGNTRKKRRIAVPVEGDYHTHKVTYMGSNQIKLREINPEFVKLQSAFQANRPAPVEGVREGDA